MFETKSLSKLPIKKIIAENHWLFPCKVTEMQLYYVNDALSISFINKEQEDITHKFISKIIKGGRSVHDHIITLLKKEEAIINELERDTIYTHKVYMSKIVPLYINSDTFFRLRMSNNYTRFALCDELGINQFSMFSLETNKPVDYSISLFVKYSLFFKRSLFDFFDKGLSKELLKICLNHFVIKGYINEDKAKEILTKETTL